jgi:hypothetical protein
MSKNSDNLDRIAELHGPFAAFLAALVGLALQVAKIYVILHFVIKYW